MVIRSGENLYPREIEEFLFRHPNIQEVQVFGVADDNYGEELCTWIKLREGEAMTAENVRECCRGHDGEAPVRKAEMAIVWTSTELDRVAP